MYTHIRYIYTKGVFDLIYFPFIVTGSLLYLPSLCCALQCLYEIECETAK